MDGGAATYGADAGADAEADSETDSGDEVHTGILLLQLPDKVLKKICMEVVLADGDNAYLRLSLVCSRLKHICSDPGFQSECHLSWLLSLHQEAYWRKPAIRQYYHSFQIVECRICYNQYKEEGDGFFGGHGRRGEVIGFYSSGSHPG